MPAAATVDDDVSAVGQKKSDFQVKTKEMNVNEMRSGPERDLCSMVSLELARVSGAVAALVVADVPEEIKTGQTKGPLCQRSIVLQAQAQTAKQFHILAYSQFMST